MKKNNPLVLFLFIIIATLQMGIQCGNSTNTGNFATFLYSRAILDSICAKLTECFDSLNSNDCEDGMRENQSVDTEIGVGANEFDTFQDIINAEMAGDIEADGANGGQCTTEIEDLACDSEEVIAAFDPNDPTNFENVTSLLSTAENSCPGTF